MMVTAAINIDLLANGLFLVSVLTDNDVTVLQKALFRITDSSEKTLTPVKPPAG